VLPVSVIVNPLSETSPAADRKVMERETGHDQVERRVVKRKVLGAGRLKRAVGRGTATGVVEQRDQTIKDPTPLADGQGWSSRCT
jgi:hypothetical protein